MGLLDAFTQYLRDALPGGLLNPESAPVANRARYASGLLDPNSQISRDAQGWHKRTQAGLKDQLAGRQTPEAEAAYQTMMQAASIAPFGVIRNLYHGTSPEAAKAIERKGFDTYNHSADGTVWFTENPNIGEVGAARKGAVVKRTIDDEKVKVGGWPEYDKYSTDELLQQGYQGLRLDDGPGTFPVWRIFDPKILGK